MSRELLLRPLRELSALLEKKEVSSEELVRATIEREGGQGIVRVELDPERKRGGPDDVRSAAAAILPPGDAATSTPQKLTLAWAGEDTLEARFPIQKTGIYLGAVDLGGGKTLPLAPLSLPYSPEFEPREDPEEGLKTMTEMARVTGGAERTAWNDVFNASRLRDRQVRDSGRPEGPGEWSAGQRS